MKQKNYTQKHMIVLKITTFLFVLSSFLSVQAQVTIGSGTKPKEGALLDLKEKIPANPTLDNSNSTKGLNIPRVNLTDKNNLFPMFTSDGAGGYVGFNKSEEDRLHVGLTVYNTSTSTQGLIPGYYFWNGETWVKMITEIPPEVDQKIGLVELASRISTTQGDHLGQGGAELILKNPIIIPEDGSYAFSLRLYGLIENLPTDRTPGRCVYYVSIWAADAPNGTNWVLKDIAEIDLYVGLYSSDNPNYTYSITLGAEFKKNKRIRIKMGHQNNQWRLSFGEGTANRTSVLWWRL